MKPISFKEALTVLASGGVVYQQCRGDHIKERMKLSEFNGSLILRGESQYYVPVTIEHAVFKLMTEHDTYLTVNRHNETYLWNNNWKQVSPWVTVEVRE